MRSARTHRRSGGIGALQLDDVVHVTSPLPDGQNVDFYGVVDELRAVQEGVRFASDAPTVEIGGELVTDFDELIDAIGHMTDPDEGAWGGRAATGTLHAFMRRLEGNHACRTSAMQSYKPLRAHSACPRIARQAQSQLCVRLPALRCRPGGPRDPLSCWAGGQRRFRPFPRAERVPERNAREGGARPAHRVCQTGADLPPRCNAIGSTSQGKA